MKNTFLSVILILTFITYPASGGGDSLGAQAGNILTVSTSGNDQNFCTDTSPCRTIQHCINVAPNGSTCKVLAGTYNERSSISKPVIVQCTQKPCITKGVTINGNGAVYDGFSVRNAVGTCGQITGDSTIQNVDCIGVSISSGNGADADCWRLFSNGPEFHRVSCSGLARGDAPHNDCWQSYSPAAINFEITDSSCDNYHYQVAADGTILKSQGFQFENGVANGQILRVLIHAPRCVNLGDPDDTKTTTNIHISHMTCIGGPRTEGRENYGIFHTKATNTTVENSIFYIDGPVFTGSGITSHHNLCFRLGGTSCVGTRNGTGDINNVDPQFVNPAIGDYSLKSSSPARGKGSDGSDLGAFQFGVTIPPTASVPTFTPSVTFTRTPTRTPTVTRTPTGSPTVTRTPVPSSVNATSSLTPVLTGTASVVPPTATRTFTRTPTPTRTITKTSTTSATPSITMTPSPTLPVTHTVTPTATPPPTFNRCDFNKDGRVSWSEFWRCIFRR